MTTTIGVLGAGQLGQMLALAGIPLGLKFVFYDPSSDACAASVGKLISASYHDLDALAKFVVEVDHITFEFENVPLDTLKFCQSKKPIFPCVTALECAQDRFNEKHTFKRLAIPTARHFPVNSLAELEAAARELGLPLVLKTTRLGYDGKGQQLIRLKSELERAWQQLSNGAPLIAEQFIKFQRELSAIGVRDHTGHTCFYALTQNVHRNGILESSCAPAPHVPPHLEAKAYTYLGSLLKELDYVGVLALELFEQDGELLANEMAPRVHNSGHWTQNGAVTSQFENHIRAGLGLPLGSCQTKGHAGMLNIVGKEPKIDKLLANPELFLHLYGKHERAGRKLGHINFNVSDADRRDQLLNTTRGLLA